MDRVEHLVALDAAIRELWEELGEIAPEKTEKLRLLLSEVSDAQNGAKSDLRAMGAGSHSIGDFVFQVKTGGTKLEFDLDDVLFEAEDNGHLDDLINSGFVKYAVDGKQVDRLPAKLRPMYKKLATEKKGTARVYLPKNLCK
jgi:8-oxo-dGTP pyrophosphatase MutT (NUDIX family)